MVTDYDVYPAQPESQPDPRVESDPRSDDPTSQPTERWHVLVEFANRGDAKPPTKIVFAPTIHRNREDALVEAQERAFSYDPPDPFSPQGRQVFRDGDGFLTVVKGAMSTFHFSTRAVRFLGDGPA